MSSDGTPVLGGMMRQRHSQGSISGGEDFDFDLDLEDDASSTPPSLLIPMTYKAKTWTQVFENFLWITSTAFILYLGDMNSNLIFLLFWDNRINRKALYLGIATIIVNIAITLYGSTTIRTSFKYPDKCAVLPSAVPLITVLGLLSFCLFSKALWPIWGFLTLPLLFTLFMAFMVVSPYIPAIGEFKLQHLVLQLS